MYLLLFTFSAILLASVNGKPHIVLPTPDSPTIGNAHKHYSANGHHETDFDHESILGSLKEAAAFKKLPLKEESVKFAELLRKMDTNGNKIIERKELFEWVERSYYKIDAIFARTALQNIDSDNDEQITWEEFLTYTHHLLLEELEIMQQNPSSETNDVVQQVADDRMKFDLADIDKNGILTVKEYAAFAHFPNYRHMAPYAVFRILQFLDANNDSRITLEEFSKLDPSGDQKELFRQIDANNDNVLDSVELGVWAMPGFEKEVINEVDHLFQQTDRNRDGVLQKEEITAQAELWVGKISNEHGEKSWAFKNEL